MDVRTAREPEPDQEVMSLVSCSHRTGCDCRHLRRIAKEEDMGKVAAGITVSLDGYVTGPNDGPACGLGVGGERLHYWVFGGPWRYDLSLIHI